LTQSSDVEMNKNIVVKYLVDIRDAILDPTDYNLIKAMNVAIEEVETESVALPCVNPEVAKLLRLVNLARATYIEENFDGETDCVTPYDYYEDFADLTKEKAFIQSRGGKLRQLIKEKLLDITKRQEYIIKAFIAETGCKPSECEYVQETRENGNIVGYIQKRDVQKFTLAQENAIFGSVQHLFKKENKGKIFHSDDFFKMVYTELKVE